MFIEFIIMFHIINTKQERELETLMATAVRGDGDGGASFSSCLDVLVLLEMKLWWWRWHREVAIRQL